MTNTGFRVVVFLAALAMATLASNAAGAKSGGAHSGSNSAGAASTSSAKARDASSGQATGKRMYKPVNAVKENARTKSPKSKLTPDKVEAGSENVRR